jgi:hypothetical protein
VLLRQRRFAGSIREKEQAGQGPFALSSLLTNLETTARNYGVFFLAF